MVAPDPAGANDRAGVVKEGHLPSQASLPMPLLRGRGLRWFDMHLSERLPLVGSYCAGRHCVSAAPTEPPSFRYQ